MVIYWKTQSPITFAVHKLCQSASSPRAPHFQAAYRILHYLKGTIGHSLFYPASSNLELSAFVDADGESYPDTRCSVSGYCMFVGTALILWKSNKQETVSNSYSSGESEYRAMSKAVQEIMWFRNLLQDLWIEIKDSAPLYCDYTAAILIANNFVFHKRTKHVELDCHIVRERVKLGMIKIF